MKPKSFKAELPSQTVSNQVNTRRASACVETDREVVVQRYRTQQKEALCANGLTRRPLGCKNFLHALCRSKAPRASCEQRYNCRHNRSTLLHSQLVQVIQVSQFTAEQRLVRLPAISRRKIDHSSDVSGRGRAHVPQRGDTQLWRAKTLETIFQLSNSLLPPSL